MAITLYKTCNTFIGTILFVLLKSYKILFIMGKLQGYNLLKQSHVTLLKQKTIKKIYICNLHIKKIKNKILQLEN